MTRHAKVLTRILRGTSDSGLGFEEVRSLLKWLGFQERIRGDHHIFSKEGVDEILNLQPRTSQAKSYQVKQVRNVIVKYQLAQDLDDE